MSTAEKPSRGGGLTRMGSLLAALIRQRHWDKQVGLHAVFDLWPRAVGREIAKRSAPRVIRGTVLWVGVTDSVWMQQLHLLKQELLQRINDSLPGREKISDLRFQLDTGLGDGDKSEMPAPVGAPSALPLDQEQLRLFAGLARSVDDADLQERLLSLWKKAHQFPPPEER